MHRQKTKRYFRANDRRSESSRSAENVGRYALKRAIRIVVEACRVSGSVAQQSLEDTWDGQWRHVGRYGAHVRYFSVRAAIDDIKRRQRLAGEQQVLFE